MTLSSMAQASGDHLFLCDENGVVVSCSDMNLACEHIGRRLQTEEFQALVQNGQFRKETTLGTFYAVPHYVVAEVIPVRADAMPEAAADSAKEIESDLEGAGGWNTWGYRQFLLDSDRLK
jgi:hypothetical protein